MCTITLFLCTLATCFMGTLSLDLENAVTVNETCEHSSIFSIYNQTSNTTWLTGKKWYEIASSHNRNCSNFNFTTQNNQENNNNETYLKVDVFYNKDNRTQNVTYDLKQETETNTTFLTISGKNDSQAVLWYCRTLNDTYSIQTVSVLSTDENITYNNMQEFKDLLNETTIRLNERDPSRCRQNSATNSTISATNSTISATNSTISATNGTISATNTTITDSENGAKIIGLSVFTIALVMLGKLA